MLYAIDARLYFLCRIEFIFMCFLLIRVKPVGSKLYGPGLYGLSPGPFAACQIVSPKRKCALERQQHTTELRTHLLTYTFTGRCPSSKFKRKSLSGNYSRDATGYLAARYALADSSIELFMFVNSIRYLPTHGGVWGPWCGVVVCFVGGKLNIVR